MIMRGDAIDILMPLAVAMERNINASRIVLIISIVLLLALLIAFSRKSPVPDYLPAENQPVGMWGYFGYSILFLLPVVGWIINLIFALGGTSNVNLKNFARSRFCLLIIAVFAVLIAALVMGVAASS